MKVIVHYSQKNNHQLGKIAAQVHAQAVIQKIKSLSCPDSQKIELIKEIKKTIAEPFC